MKLLRPLLIVAGQSFALAAVLLVQPLSAAQSGPDPLIDFTANSRERDGTVIHEYEYAFGDWQKHVIDLPRRGVLIQAPNGKGGLGQGRWQARLKNVGKVRLHYVIGNANKTQTLNLSMEDADGTECVWRVTLSAQPPGREFGQLFDLAAPTQVAKPGKKPGLDLKKIYTWQVRGDWTDAPVEVLLISLLPE